jgi:hypothetical protein
MLDLKSLSKEEKTDILSQIFIADRDILLDFLSDQREEILKDAFLRGLLVESMIDEHFKKYDEVFRKLA